MNQFDIETSRHVRLTYVPASVLQRIFGWLIDASLYVTYLIAAFWTLGIFFTSSGAIPQEIGWVSYLIVFTPYFLYFPLMETAWNGRTIGKKVVGIRVVRVDGSRVSFGSYLVRWLFRFIEITGTGGVVAILTILINGKGQRLGDIVAKTTVIHEEDLSLSQRDLTQHMDQNHSIVFRNAAELDDQDIRVIKEVLYTSSQYSDEVRRKMLHRTRTLIEKKTGETDSSLNAETFLKTILKDYTSIYGSAMND